MFSSSINPSWVPDNHNSHLVWREFIFGQSQKNSATFNHRRKVNTEEKAKEVAAVWGAEFFQFLAVLAVFLRTILKKRMNSSFSFKSSSCNSSYYSKSSIGKKVHSTPSRAGSILTVSEYLPFLKKLFPNICLF